MTYFNQTIAAERYAAARPYFHPLVVQIIRRLCQLKTCDAALDVGCGTGQSSVPLAELARLVVGVDLSPAMLAQAMSHNRVSYLQALAEALPLQDRTFDLLTVGLAFHWLKREPFLREASRVLLPGGWLVLYNDAFCGQMAENAEFPDWFRGQYLQRYPSPPRDGQPLTENAAAGFGFGGLAQESYSRATVMSAESLVAYLLTQSNIAAALEAGRESLKEIQHWLLSQVEPLFISPRGTFTFVGSVQACRKAQ